MVTGVLLALSAAACLGLSNAVGRIAIARSSVYTTALWTLVPTTAVLPLVVVAFVLNGIVGPADIASLPFFVGAGVCGDFFARLSLIGAVERLGASRAVAFRILAPLVSLAAGLLLLGEHLTWKAAVGIGFMLVGISVVQYDGLRRDRRSTPVDAAAIPPYVHEPCHETDDTATAGSLLRPCPPSPVAVVSDEAGRSWVRNGLLYGLSAGMAFGLADIFRKAGMNAGGHPVSGAFASATTGMVLYLTVALRSGIRQHLQPPRDAYLPLLGAGTAILCGVVLLLSALQRIPVALGSTISSTQVFFAMFFARQFNQGVEQVSLSVVAGGVLAFAGFILVIGLV